MKYSKSKATAIFVVGLLLVAGGAMAAAPVVDTETTDTSSKSEITDGMTITNFEANSSNTSILQADYDSDNPEVRVLNEDNETIKTFSASDMTETNSSQDYYNATINHSVWNNVPIAPNGTTTVYLQLVNNTQADNPDLTNVSITLEGAEGRTVRVVDSDLSDSTFSTEAKGFLDSSILGFGGEDTATYEPSSGVAINGTNSTVTVHFENGTTQSSLSSTIEELDTSAWAKGIVVQTDKGPVKTYLGSAPDDANTSETYAVYDSEANDLVIHAGDEYQGDSEIKGLTVTTNAGWKKQISVYGWEYFGLSSLSMDIPLVGMVSMPGVSFAGLLFAFSTRRVSLQ